MNDLPPYHDKPVTAREKTVDLLLNHPAVAIDAVTIEVLATKIEGFYSKQHQAVVQPAHRTIGKIRFMADRQQKSKDPAMKAFAKDIIDTILNGGKE